MYEGQRQRSKSSGQLTTANKSQEVNVIVLRDGVKLLGLHVSDKASNATDTPTTNPDVSSMEGSVTLPLCINASDNNSNRDRSNSMSYATTSTASRRASVLSTTRSLRGVSGGVTGGSSQYSVPSQSETSSQGTVDGVDVTVAVMVVLVVVVMVTIMVVVVVAVEWVEFSFFYHGEGVFI